MPLKARFSIRAQILAASGAGQNCKSAKDSEVFPPFSDILFPGARKYPNERRAAYPMDLTDAQWNEIKPLYVGMRNRKWSKRKLTNAALCVTQSSKTVHRQQSAMSHRGGGRCAVPFLSVTSIARQAGVCRASARTFPFSRLFTNYILQIRSTCAIIVCHGSACPGRTPFAVY